MSLYILVHCFHISTYSIFRILPVSSSLFLKKPISSSFLQKNPSLISEDVRVESALFDLISGHRVTFRQLHVTMTSGTLMTLETPMLL